jgi:hypothetical protein
MYVKDSKNGDECELELEEVLLCSFINTEFKITESQLANLHRFLKIKSIERCTENFPLFCQSNHFQHICSESKFSVITKGFNLITMEQFIQNTSVKFVFSNQTKHFKVDLYVEIGDLNANFIHNISKDYWVISSSPYDQLKILIIMDLRYINFNIITKLAYFEQFKGLEYQMLRLLTISKRLLICSAKIHNDDYLLKFSIDTGNEIARVQLLGKTKEIFTLADSQIILSNYMEEFYCLDNNDHWLPMGVIPKPELDICKNIHYFKRVFVYDEQLAVFDSRHDHSHYYGRITTINSKPGFNKLHTGQFKYRKDNNVFDKTADSYFKWNRNELTLILNNSSMVNTECYLQAVFFSKQKSKTIFSGIQINLGENYDKADILKFYQKSKNLIIFKVIARNYKKNIATRLSITCSVNKIAKQNKLISKWKIETS